MKLYCDKQTTIYIASNLLFYNTIETDFHFIRKLLLVEISTDFTNYSNQLANTLNESLDDLKFNLYVPSLVHTMFLLQLEGKSSVMLILYCF